MYENKLKKSKNGISKKKKKKKKNDTNKWRHAIKLFYFLKHFLWERFFSRFTALTHKNAREKCQNMKERK